MVVRTSKIVILRACDKEPKKPRIPKIRTFMYFFGICFVFSGANSGRGTSYFSGFSGFWGFWGQTKVPLMQGYGNFSCLQSAKAHRRSTVQPHALLLMKISPTDAHEEPPFWPFWHMKRELVPFGHARVWAFGAIPGPLPHAPRNPSPRGSGIE